MEPDNSHRTKRIAKNTLMLYVRMLFLLLVGLYTSRIVLAALGEDDFGIYNVVGGTVAMFSIISGALNAAITRFITFEMGKGVHAQLRKVYSTAVTIQFVIALIVVALSEPAGLWFIEHKMTIEPERIPAAKWVLQFSIASFAINLMSVPQMASITAHERMSAYAYIGILDGLLRLGVAFMILRSPVDRLVYYSALMTVSVLIVRAAYGIYCRRNFSECRYSLVFDRKLMKDMFSFAGWNFIGVTSGVLRDHGGNILVNLFSTPAVNAARAIAVQLNSAIQNFVTNFMTAVNPQITKSYAAGEKEYMFSLVKRSSRMSFCLLLLLALPVLFNTEFLLGLWLKEVPAHTVLFVRLFLIFALSESLSNPMITAMLATGNIRNYQIVVGGLQLLNLPVSYVLLRMGAVPEVTVMVAIVISQICLFARMMMLSSETGFPVKEYLNEVYLPMIFKVAAVSSVIPLALCFMHLDGTGGFLLSAGACLISSSSAVYVSGLTSGERAWIKDMVHKALKRR